MNFILLIFSLMLYNEEIRLTSSDGCIISAEINIKDSKNPFVIEVHGLGSDRKEWDKLNTNLSKNNINYISIDLRGHGNSTLCGKRTIKYPNISNKDISKFTDDVKLFAEYIEKKYPDSKIIPLGASIGANIVMKLFYKKADKIILLAPGLNYAGYEISELFKKTKAQIMFGVSEDDIYSLSSVRVFMQILDMRKIKYSLLLAEKGHGAEIFRTNKGDEYISRVINFIKS